MVIRVDEESVWSIINSKPEGLYKELVIKTIRQVEEWVKSKRSVEIRAFRNGLYSSSHPHSEKTEGSHMLFNLVDMRLRELGWEVDEKEEGVDG